MIDDIQMEDRDFPDDEQDASRARLPDSIRRALLSGISAVMMTEEGIRSALGDMRLPKEALSYLAQQTDRTRRELFRAVSDEVKGFLKSTDLTGELRKALTGLKVNVKAEVTFTDVSAPTAKLEASVSDADDAPTEKTPKRKSHRKKKTKARRRS
jgi:hypothetical protein